MKVVNRVSKIRVNSPRNIRKKPTSPFVSKINRARFINLTGKKGGTGLSDYSLDVMILD